MGWSTHRCAVYIEANALFGQIFFLNEVISAAVVSFRLLPLNFDPLLTLLARPRPASASRTLFGVGRPMIHANARAQFGRKGLLDGRFSANSVGGLRSLYNI